MKLTKIVVCDKSGIQWLWWLCNVSAWLGWTTFPRSLFPVCFWLEWAPREILLWDLKGGSEAAAILELTHTLSFIFSLRISVKQQPGLQLLRLPFSFSSSKSWAWSVFSYMINGPSFFLQDTQPLQVTELTQVSVSPHASASGLFCSFQLATHLLFLTTCPASDMR